MLYSYYASKQSSTLQTAGGFNDENASKTAITNDQPRFLNTRTLEKLRRGKTEKRRGRGKKEGEGGRRPPSRKLVSIEATSNQRSVSSASVNSKQTHVEHDRSVHTAGKGKLQRNR